MKLFQMDIIGELFSEKNCKEILHGKSVMILVYHNSVESILYVLQDRPNE